MKPRSVWPTVRLAPLSASASVAGSLPPVSEKRNQQRKEKTEKTKISFAVSERASEREPFKKDDENIERERGEEEGGGRAIGPWQRDRCCLKWSQETTDRTADWEGDMGGGKARRRFVTKEGRRPRGVRHSRYTTGSGR